MKYRGEELHPVISTIFSGIDASVVIVVTVVLLLAGSQLPKLVQITSQLLREFPKPQLSEVALPQPGSIGSSNGEDDDKAGDCLYHEPLTCGASWITCHQPLSCFPQLIPSASVNIMVYGWRRWPLGNNVSLPGLSVSGFSQATPESAGSRAGGRSVW
jgi:hypothetical protein